MNIKRLICDIPRIYDNFKCNVHDWFFPWNVIKIKTLSRNFHDRDTVILHANFQILTDFVEQELFSNHHEILVDVEREIKTLQDFDYSPEEIKKCIDAINKSNSDILKLMKLYKWWTIERPLREENYPKYPENMEKTILLMTSSKPVFLEWADNYKKYEQAGEQEDEDNLIELIKLKKYMWT